MTGTDGTLQAGDVTAEEVGFLAGLTGNVQEQINRVYSIKDISKDIFEKKSQSIIKETEGPRATLCNGVVQIYGNITVNKNTSYLPEAYVIKQQYRPANPVVQSELRKFEYPNFTNIGVAQLSSNTGIIALFFKEINTDVAMYLNMVYIVNHLDSQQIKYEGI